jgi:hypothetical protein
LVIETPLQSRGFDAKTGRKAVLERLFKLSSIGRRGRSESKDAAVEDSDGGSFLKRINLQQSMTERHKWTESEESTDVEVTEKKSHGRSRKRRIGSDTSIYKDIDPERPVAQPVKPKPRKRRRFDADNTEDDSEGGVYEEGSDLENQSIQSASEPDPSTSDVDELSISIDNPRPALRGIPLNNRKLSHRTSKSSLSKSLLVRESSPILLDDESDDELAI